MRILTNIMMVVFLFIITNSIKEQEKLIDDLRKELAKEKQTNANTGWVEYDDKNI